MASISPDHYNRVYLTSNELYQEKNLQTLSKHKLNGNGMLGVSAFFLLNAASVRATTCSQESNRIDHLIVVDVSERVEDFWTQMKPIIEKAANRQVVLQETVKLLNEKKKQYYGDMADFSVAQHLKELDAEIGSGKSWLSTDDQFKRIQEIFKKGHFQFHKINLTDTEAVEKLTSSLNQQQITLDSVYISNVTEWMETGGQRLSFMNSMEKLIGPKTFLILTKPRAQKSFSFLEQHIVKRPQGNTSIPANTFFPPSTELVKKAASIFVEELRDSTTDLEGCPKDMRPKIETLRKNPSDKNLYHKIVETLCYDPDFSAAVTKQESVFSLLTEEDHK